MGKCRPRQIKEVAQSHTSGKWQIQAPSPSDLDAGLRLTTTVSAGNKLMKMTFSCLANNKYAINDKACVCGCVQSGGSDNCALKVVY